jgi:DNA-binding NtrC family response regulator
VKSVLVVDDIPEVRRRIGVELGALRAHVLEAADGIDALHTLDRVPVAVVVSDLRMPRMDGLELLRRLRHGGTPVILHSGYADVQAAVEGLRLGAVDFLPAPLDYGRLRERVSSLLSHREAVEEQLVGTSPALEATRARISRVADASEPVLITGESGVGKEMVARAIHAASARRDGPFVAVNLCALAGGTVESELFGHERGAFTGALARHAGRFEQADGGTLLLDEVGDAPRELQAKLLRAVENHCFERVGGREPVRVDVRILAATNRDLPTEIARGRFREDLWYRLSALRIHIPPLRERPADVDALVRLELARCSEARGSLPFELDAEGYARLHAESWPGNVRELRFTVRRMAILAGERRMLDAEDVERALDLRESGAAAEPERPANGFGLDPSSRAEFDARDRAETVAALNAHRWNVSAAARALGLSRGSLRRRMQRLGLAGGAPGSA